MDDNSQKTLSDGTGAAKKRKRDCADDVNDGWRQNAIGEDNAKRRKKATHKCAICGLDSLYCYYGVQGCEGCKQFFRRVIVKQKAFYCWKVRRCDIWNGERCRGCRLDKCLAVGMDPAMVNVPLGTKGLAAFVARMEERRAQLVALAEKSAATPSPSAEQFPSPHSQAPDSGQSGCRPPLLAVKRETTKHPATPGLDGSDWAEGQQHQPSVQRTVLPETNTVTLRQTMPSAEDTLASLPVSTLGCPPTSIVPSFTPTDRQMADFHTLSSLLHVEQKLKRIWDSPRELPSEYLKQFSSLRDILSSTGNILGRAHEFPGNPLRHWDKTGFLEEVSKHGFFFADNINLLTKDRILCVELAKTLPFFQRLELDDQIVLLRTVSGPIEMFFNAFYAYKLGASTWTQSDGLTLMSIFDNRRWEKDTIVQHLSRSLCCSTVDVFHQAGIGTEEFVLLVAIVYATSTSSDLSVEARQILYDESVKHSCALLRLLQQRYGPAVGVQKYAAAIRLVNASFHFDNRFQILSTYLEVFFTRTGPEQYFHRAILDLIQLV